MNKPQVTIYCDGGVYPTNPGKLGAYGIVLRYHDACKTLHGSYAIDGISNIRAEMIAAITALEALKTACEVTIYSDLQTLVKGGNREQGRNTNLDLWQQLDDLMAVHTVRFEWVRGHSLIPDNERAHDLVQIAIREATKS